MDSKEQKLIGKEQGVSNFVRPRTFEDLVGLDEVKEMIINDIVGSEKLGEPIPSFILSGVQGTGKSSVAFIIANQLGSNVYEYIGSNLKKTNDLTDIAVRAKDKDVIIVEEAHSLPPGTQSQILVWIESYRIYDTEAGAPLNAPKVCWIFPTTSAGKLIKPLVNRCRTLQLGYYNVSQIREILIRAGNKYGLDLASAPDALNILANSSRASPRTAVINRLDLLRKFMAAKNLEFNTETVRQMMKLYKISDYGLEKHDSIYLETLYDKLMLGGGRPVSHKVLLQTTGLGKDTLDIIIEAYLIQTGIISITHGGRIITPFGYKILDREPIVTQSIEVLREPSEIDAKQLEKLLEDPEVRKGGMKKICQIMNLPYPASSYLLKLELGNRGWAVRQRSGIVPME